MIVLTRCLAIGFVETGTSRVLIVLKSADAARGHSFDGVIWLRKPTPEERLAVRATLQTSPIQQEIDPFEETP